MAEQLQLAFQQLVPHVGRIEGRVLLVLGGLHFLRLLDVTQRDEHVELRLDGCQGAQNWRAHPAKTVRNDGVEFVRQGFQVVLVRIFLFQPEG